MRLLISSMCLLWMACAPCKELVRTSYTSVQDTVVTKQTQVDTVLLTRARDTIQLVKERLNTKIIRKTDTLYVQSACLPDTIYRTVNVPVKVEERIKPKRPWYETWQVKIIVLLLVATLLTKWLIR